MRSYENARPKVHCMAPHYALYIDHDRYAKIVFDVIKLAKHRTRAADSCWLRAFQSRQPPICSHMHADLWWIEPRSNAPSSSHGVCPMLSASVQRLPKFLVVGPTAMPRFVNERMHSDLQTNSYLLSLATFWVEPSGIRLKKLLSVLLKSSVRARGSSTHNKPGRGGAAAVMSHIIYLCCRQKRTASLQSTKNRTLRSRCYFGSSTALGAASKSWTECAHLAARWQ